MKPSPLQQSWNFFIFRYINQYVSDGVPDVFRSTQGPRGKVLGIPDSPHVPTFRLHSTNQPLLPDFAQFCAFLRILVIYKNFRIFPLFFPHFAYFW